MAQEVSGVKKAVAVKKGRSAEASIRYTLDIEKRLVKTKFGSVITEQAIRDYSKLLRVDPNFSPTFSEIVDFTEVEKVELSGDQIMRLAENADPFSREARRAFVVRNKLQNHEARMYNIVRVAGDSIRTFYSADEAERWILSTRGR